MSTKHINYIVMADDDDDDYEFFRIAVEKACHPVKISHAVNWIDLLRYLNKERLPDVIFLDLNIPIKTGLECLQSIRAEKKYDDISVIIYSTSNSSKDIDETYSNGANYYVIKPDNLENISRIIDKICTMDKEKLLATPDKAEYVIS